MTGATPFAMDAWHAVSKRSVEIIAWDSLRFGQNVTSRETPTQRSSGETEPMSGAEK
jgi:hypothetical protein